MTTNYKFEQILDSVKTEFKNKLMFSIADICKITGYCSKTVERSIINKELKSVRKTPRSARLVFRDDLVRWLCGLNN